MRRVVVVALVLAIGWVVAGHADVVMKYYSYGLGDFVTAETDIVV